MAISATYQPSPVITELGEGFYDEVEAADFPKHVLRFRNQRWAERVGLGELTPSEWETHFARFEALPENLPKPLALRYHGHQFTSYNPDLGDGRGFLFAQFKSDGRLLDLGTKGSGTTPWSRRGDGRLTLKGAVREVLATEMLEAHGVYTSKTFSVFETGEELQRGDEPSPTRSGVLVRLNHSHIRFGSFQRHAYHQDKERLAKLVDYSIRHYFPALEKENDRAAALLKAIAIKAADLAAAWMTAGFVHGVLNTDNMNITGESFDYGPYRFLPTFDPEFTAAYFDHSGLYAYGRQPEAVLWNLQQLATALMALSTEPALVASIQEFAPRFNASITRKFVEKLGLASQGEEKDGALFVAGYDVLSKTQTPFEQFFFDWYGGQSERARLSPEASRYQAEVAIEFGKMLQNFQPLPSVQARLKDPYFSRAKPCTLLIDEIEWIWDSIAKADDWSRFEAKIAEIREMGKVYEQRLL